MKTNQNLIRKMGDFHVIQRTSDGMFNATDLMKQWNNAHPDEKRTIDNFWKTTNLDKLMSEIAENELNFKSVDFTDLKKVLSATSRGRQNGGTFMNPILYIKFAMYLSPRFEYHVLKFVSDDLLKYRNEAGDAYKEMTGAIASIVSNKKELPLSIKNVARALNYIVYNSHERELRNKQDEENKARELAELEKDIAKLINQDFIKSFNNLVNYLRRLWREKYMPKELRT